ncbi:MAG: rhomboid family intramembrane serine protease [Pseudomonadota bacterium]
MNNFESPAAAVLFAVTLGISLLGLYRMPQLIDRFVMRPYLVARGKSVETVITSGFVHADLGHLLFNMVTFYFFAFPMERFLGTPAFIALYFLGLILSSACSLGKARSNPAYATLGASGAISAVLFAYVIYFPFSTLIIFPIPVPIPAFLFAVLYVGYSWWAGKNRRDNINHDAHLCGAVTGIVFVVLTDPGVLGRMFQ